MARGASDTDEGGRLSRWLAAHWDDECCGEHDGTVPSFEALSMRLDDLADFPLLLKRKRRNRAKLGKMVAVVGGAGIVALPVAFIAAPGIAAWLGGAGYLGAAGTGTAISSLSGAALTSASLAAVGGTVAAGITVVSAVGSALIGVGGGLVFNAYADEVKGFDIRRCRDGTGPALVMIDGFLESKADASEAWLEGVGGEFPGPHYHLQWEPKRLRQIGGAFSKASVADGFAKVALKLATRGTKKAARGAAGGVVSAPDLMKLAANPWHVAQFKAGMAGVMLATLLARTNHPEGFVLIGHSLGARVIRYALEALAAGEGPPIVHAVHLLGGAVGNDAEGWTKAKAAVSGEIVNYHSDHDLVLSALYRAANLFTSVPIGSGPIDGVVGVRNVDVSEVVGGHAKYLPNLRAVLAQRRVLG